MTPPNFGLALAYWLHIIATVVWIGGIMSLSLLVIPAARRTLDANAYAALFTRLQAGLQRIGWLSLAVLIATGMFQMSAHPSYDGLLALTNSWAVAIFAKHILVGLMVAVSAYITWGLMPSLSRMNFQMAAGLNVDDEKKAGFLRREKTALNLNLILSILVLLLTAIARSA